jgi:hypothetical protein
MKMKYLILDQANLLPRRSPLVGSPSRALMLSLPTIAQLHLVVTQCLLHVVERTLNWFVSKA